MNENRIEGRNAVIEAFRSGRTIDRLYMLDGSREGAMQTVRKEAAKHGTPVKYVTKQRLDQMSETGRHQGVIAEVAAYSYGEMEDLFEKAYGLLALHRRGDRPIRSLSVRATSLSEEVGQQLTMFPETDSLGKREELETCIDALRNRYGSGILKRGIVMWDSALSGGEFGIDREETWAVAQQT